MNIIIKNFKLLSICLATIALITSCNKDVEQLSEGFNVPTGVKLGDTIKNTPSQSLFYDLLVKTQLINELNDSSRSFTVFAPNNEAIKEVVSYLINSDLNLSAILLSFGLPPITPQLPDSIFSQLITLIPDSLNQAQVTPLIQYHIVPQKLLVGPTTEAFPNFQYPTIFNPSPSLSDLLRLTTFVSSRNGAFVNNIPITNPNIVASNGVVHEIAAVNMPPSQFMWDRISTDTGLTILKAAIERADSAGPALQSVLGLEPSIAIGANFTLFAPTNLAMKQLLSALPQGNLPVAAPDAAFINFLGSNFVSTEFVSGLIAYHVFDGRDVTNKPGVSVARPGRTFLNNFPAVTNNYPTLLNSDSAAVFHPGLFITSTFSGPIVTAATVKGLGNATASNILINPYPNGSSDQHYLNGVMHKIDQVLLPQ